MLLLLLFCWKKCCGNEKCAVPDNAAVESVAESNSPIADNGSSVSITLPDGRVFEIPKNSPEFELFSFLNSPDAQNDGEQAEKWITLDKVRFDNGKANLAEGAETQLNNIANLMQMYPNTNLKVGGYTDNTGNNKINLKVSTERAKVAADKIIGSGIDAERITHEGFGSQRPVCPPNDTDECRAENRRVDIMITRK